MLDPRGHLTIQRGTLAPRITSLRGATLGLLDNSKRNSDILLATIGQELKDRYGVSETIETTKPSASHVVSAQLQQLLARCHAIITGVGD